jgi:transposase
VDTNGLPVHLALTPGEAHDNRLCSVLLSALLPQTMLLADRGYDADWIRELARQQGAWANIPPKRNRKDPICFSPYLYRARNWSSASSTRSSSVGVSRPDMTNSRPTIWRSLNSHQSEFGCALMSPRPSTTLADRWFAAIFRIPESIFQ